MNDRLRTLRRNLLLLRRAAIRSNGLSTTNQSLLALLALAVVVFALGGHSAAMRRGWVKLTRSTVTKAVSANVAPAAVNAPLVTLAQAACTDNPGASLSNCVPGTGTCPYPYPDVMAVGMLNGRDNAYNVFIGGNLTIGGPNNVPPGAAEMEGKVFVYGNMTLNKRNNGTYNMGYAGAGTGVLPDALTDWVTVGGNISVPSHNGSSDSTRFIIGGLTLGGQDIRGNLRYKGTLTPPLDGVFPDPIDVPNNSQVIHDTALNLAPFDATFATLATKSGCWGALATSTNGSFTAAGNQYTFRSLNNAAGLYVFNVGVDLDNGTAGLLNFQNFPDTATILINMNKPGTGDTITINLNNVSGLSAVLRERILWNFPDATTVNFTGNAPFFGSVLIPSRTSTANVSMVGMNGRFIVGGNLNHTGNGSAEFHNYPFRGELPCCSAGTVSCNVTGAASACTGTTNTYSVTTVPETLTNATYSWTLTNAGGATASINGSATNPTVSVNAGTTGGSYTLTVNITSTEGSTTCSATATVNPSPTAAAGPDQALCQTGGGPTAFTLSGTVTGGTLQWSQLASTGTASASIVSPTSASTIVNVSGLGTVTLQLTVTSNTTPSCGTATDTVVLTVTQNAVALAGDDQTRCQTVPGPTVFTVTGSGGTPSWTVFATTSGATATIVSPNSATTSVNVTGTGTVTLRLTTTSSCGTATDDVVLTVIPPPVVMITAAPTVCGGSPGNTASVAGAGAGATYLWTITGGTITGGQGTRSITYTAGPVGTTTLSVTVMNSAGCSASATLSINAVLCDLIVTKSVDRPTAKVTEIVTFTIPVRNNGQLPATNVVVNDLLPAGYVFVSATPSQGSYNAATGVWTVGTLAAGATTTLQIRAAVNAPGPYLNTATAASDQFDAVPGNNTSSASVQPLMPYGPGQPYPPSSEISDQRAGSVLIYNYYTSDVSSPAINTRLSLTNIEGVPVAVHLFFVDGATCSVADAFLCLSANQTISFLASDYDPGTSGYVIAVASDARTGCPINFNCLIGDGFVKAAGGFQANLGAEAVAALAGGLPTCDENTTTATLDFNGVTYNRLPRVLAADNLADNASGNQTQLIINRIGGNLATGADRLGTLFGLLYDDLEQSYSFQLAGGVCQLRGTISGTFPRTVPRIDQVIPAGRSGWLKLYDNTGGAILGVQLVNNANVAASATAFRGGHNLHKLTFAPTTSLIIPIFPPRC